LASNQAAAEVLDEFDVAAATDVTGFGLAGHLLEMLRASEVSAEIQLGELPLLDGAIDLFGEGLQSTLDPSNRAAEQEMLSDNARELLAYPALFDPQTCGGLLFGVRSDQVSQCLARLAATPTSGTVIGRVLPADDEPPLRVLWSNGSR
jgi:selenide,water dikinase